MQTGTKWGFFIVAALTTYAFFGAVFIQPYKTTKNEPLVEKLLFQMQRGEAPCESSVQHGYRIDAAAQEGGSCRATAVRDWWTSGVCSFLLEDGVVRVDLLSKKSGGHPERLTAESTLAMQEKPEAWAAH